MIYDGRSAHLPTASLNSTDLRGNPPNSSLYNDQQTIFHQAIAIRAQTYHSRRFQEDMLTSLRACSRLREDLSTCRLQSTLAKTMKQAVAGINPEDIKEDQKQILSEQRDSKGEPFRPVFLGSKRKLRIRSNIERETGQVVVQNLPRGDLFQRIMVRRPRKEEMSTEQDWPSVWPVARSFRSSVVPLPIRMGARKHPERRAPFKTEGNLELVKIPNFLHLTPAAIERHCSAIKKFCTKWPEKMDEKIRRKFFPLTLSYCDYVHQSNSLRDMRSRVITVKLKISELHLDEHALDKLIRLAGEKCFTRKQNYDYAMYLLIALYSESHKVEDWEVKKFENIRLVSRTTDFKGSKMENDLQNLLNNIEKRKGNDTNTKQNVDSRLKEFSKSWENYRNSKETFETVRIYAESIKKLLGVSQLPNQKG
uniref:Ribosomal protein S24/S35 mitochondrial conserved domain-containing protein n=1 Tax=Setaria digitata TaxID=48799 RepID=A0A915Q720_9BILA